MNNYSSLYIGYVPPDLDILGGPNNQTIDSLTCSRYSPMDLDPEVQQLAQIYCTEVQDFRKRAHDQMQDPIYKKMYNTIKNQTISLMQCLQNQKFLIQSRKNFLLSISRRKNIFQNLAVLLTEKLYQCQERQQISQQNPIKNQLQEKLLQFATYQSKLKFEEINLFIFLQQRIKQVQISFREIHIRSLNIQNVKKTNVYLNTKIHHPQKKNANIYSNQITFNQKNNDFETILKKKQSQEQTHRQNKIQLIQFTEKKKINNVQLSKKQLKISQFLYKSVLQQLNQLNKAQKLLPNYQFSVVKSLIYKSKIQVKQIPFMINLKINQLSFILLMRRQSLKYTLMHHQLKQALIQSTLLPINVYNTTPNSTTVQHQPLLLDSFPQAITRQEDFLKLKFIKKFEYEGQTYELRQNQILFKQKQNNKGAVSVQALTLNNELSFGQRANVYVSDRFRKVEEQLFKAIILVLRKQQGNAVNFTTFKLNYLPFISQTSRISYRSR